MRVPKTYDVFVQGPQGPGGLREPAGAVFPEIHWNDGSGPAIETKEHIRGDSYPGQHENPDTAFQYIVVGE